MGGLDIFMSYMSSPSEGFGAPMNLGYPINSVYDDYNIAVTADGKTAYLSAVRDSGIGDYDLYKVTLEKSLVQNPLCWVAGKGVTNVGTPAKGAFAVITTPSSGDAVATMETNEANGRFDVALPPGTYKVVLKHAKAGKAEADLVIEPGTSRMSVELKFP
jgi:hypothetical protein